MKVIKVPSPVQLRDPLTKQMLPEMTFRNYAIQFWLNDSRWLKPTTNILLLGRIQPLFDTTPGKEFVLENMEWDLIVDIIKTPFIQANGVPNTLAPLYEMQVGSFRDAIREARTESAGERIAKDTPPRTSRLPTLSERKSKKSQSN